MTDTLDQFASIGSIFAIKIEYEDGERNPKTIYFTDYHSPIEIDGTLYDGIGDLLSISESEVELRAAPSEVTVTISGLGNVAAQDILQNRYKGAKIDILRVFVDAKTSEILDISNNPAGRFRGLITNISINEEFDIRENTASNTIGFICSSQVSLINRKVAGRKTNSTEQRNFFPNDSAMDRVGKIANSNFNFGAPE